MCFVTRTCERNTLYTGTYVGKAVMAISSGFSPASSIIFIGLHADWLPAWRVTSGKVIVILQRQTICCVQDVINSIYNIPIQCSIRILLLAVYMSILRRILDKVLDRVLEQLNARFAQPCIIIKAYLYAVLYTAANKILDLLVQIMACINYFVLYLWHAHLQPFTTFALLSVTAL